MPGAPSVISFGSPRIDRRIRNRVETAKLVVARGRTRSQLLPLDSRRIFVYARNICYALCVVSTLESRRSGVIDQTAPPLAPFGVNSTAHAAVCQNLRSRTLTGVFSTEFKFVYRVSRAGKQTANEM